ncbi:MAG: AAA family ATPase [Gammaproteobacteria bacterium]|nr:AAA family ATPase [Gammaproteobacteria bacterium]MCF6259999.1 AAA family ATPase [Gammaproteobacteria bacterium]
MLAQVFSVANQKGGTGKTTLSMNLAAGFSRRGRTLIIDADPQGSAGQWAGLSTDERPFPVSVISVASNLAREVSRMRQDYQYLVIDCPPTLETGVAQSAMSISDKVFVPILPSPVDLWASVRLTDAIDQIKISNSRLQAYILINQLELRSAMSRSMSQALAEFDMPTLQSCLRRRAVYRNSALEGLSVYCMGKRGESAVQEVEFLIEEILTS